MQLYDRFRDSSGELNKQFDGPATTSGAGFLIRRQAVDQPRPFFTSWVSGSGWLVEESGVAWRTAKPTISATAWSRNHVTDTILTQPFCVVWDQSRAISYRLGT